MPRRFYSSVLLLAACSTSSCTLIKIADTAASATIGAASTTIKATGKVVEAAIPDGDKGDDN